MYTRCNYVYENQIHNATTKFFFRYFIFCFVSDEVVLVYEITTLLSNAVLDNKTSTWPIKLLAYFKVCHMNNSDREVIIKLYSGVFRVKGIEVETKEVYVAVEKL